MTLWWLPDVDTDAVEEVVDEVGDKWWWAPLWYRFWLSNEWAWNWVAVGDEGTVLLLPEELLLLLLLFWWFSAMAAAAATATAAEFRMFDEDVEL